MAMKIFNPDEWRAELETRWKLTRSGEKTATTEIWLSPKGHPISIPVLPDNNYPDSLLNLVEERLRAYGEHPFDSTGTGATASPSQPTPQS